ncbi:MAG: hypothetical protein N2109_08640, partial [Fimbriimonadales bacterium]|nr:hypothetical protein [Fimbriimonadales bacterium]
GYDFPLDLHPGEDVDELVKQASKAMQTQCRDPHAKSRHGNPTRRLKIFVRGPWETAQELEDYLAAP